MDVIAKFIGLVGLGMIVMAVMSVREGYLVGASGPRRPYGVGEIILMSLFGTALVALAVFSHIASNRK
jgi:hypothetical protein